MFSNPTHCPEPPVAYPTGRNPTGRTSVPLCTLRDVQSQGEHMGSDWCKRRTGRFCPDYTRKCNYGRLCPHIHSVAHRVICLKVRQMIVGMADSSGHPIVCDDSCPLVPYGGHWPAFGECNEVVSPPAVKPDTIMAMRWVDHPGNLNSASMGVVCGFWTPNGFAHSNGQKLNWVAGDPDCLLSPTLCGTGRTSGRLWQHSRKHQPGYGTITRRIPRQVFFGREGVLRPLYRFPKTN